MHVLTTRGGEVVCLEPVRDEPGCTGSAGLVGLDSAQLVEFASVADRPDIGTTALVSAAAGFLKRTGWVDQDPEVIAEYALDMMALSTEVAGRYPPGTKIRAAFDRDTDEWLITRLDQCDDPHDNPAQPPPSCTWPSGW